MMCVHYVFSDTGIIIISQRGIGNGSYLATLGQGLIEATKCMYDCNVVKSRLDSACSILPTVT